MATQAAVQDGAQTDGSRLGLSLPLLSGITLTPRERLAALAAAPDFPHDARRSAREIADGASPKTISLGYEILPSSLEGRVLRILRGFATDPEKTLAQIEAVILAAPVDRKLAAGLILQDEDDVKQLLRIANTSLAPTAFLEAWRAAATTLRVQCNSADFDKRRDAQKIARPLADMLKLCAPTASEYNAELSRVAYGVKTVAVTLLEAAEGNSSEDLGYIFQGLPEDVRTDAAEHVVCEELTGKITSRTKHDLAVDQLYRSHSSLLGMLALKELCYACIAPSSTGAGHIREACELLRGAGHRAVSLAPLVRRMIDEITDQDSKDALRRVLPFVAGAEGKVRVAWEQVISGPFDVARNFVLLDMISEEFGPDDRYIKECRAELGRSPLRMGLPRRPFPWCDGPVAQAGDPFHRFVEAPFSMLHLAGITVAHIAGQAVSLHCTTSDLQIPGVWESVCTLTVIHPVRSLAILCNSFDEATLTMLTETLPNFLSTERGKRVGHLTVIFSGTSELTMSPQEIIDALETALQPRAGAVSVECRILEGAAVSTLQAPSGAAVRSSPSTTDLFGDGVFLSRTLEQLGLKKEEIVLTT